MKFPWHKKHHHKPATYWPPAEPECEEAEDMTPTEAKEELRKLMQANVQPTAAGVAYPNNAALQAQLPFGQPMYNNAMSQGKTVTIESGNVIIKKVHNGYLLHVYTNPFAEPKTYVCGDADDVGEALKVALVNLRIDAAK